MSQPDGPSWPAATPGAAPSPLSLSIVIPVLNEEEEIVGMLRAATALLDGRPGDGEILVVDNASTDRTLRYAQPFVDAGTVRILRNEVNRGKGYSIRRGMLEARGDLRLMCDADCVGSLGSLTDLEAAVGSVDVAVGSRLTDGARVGRQQALRRRVVGFGFIALTRVAMGRLPRDVYCGFKLWRAQAAEAVFEQARSDGWVFDAEALAMARRMGFALREVGIDWTNRPDSRLSIRNVLLPVVGELWAARRNVHRAAGARSSELEEVRSSQPSGAS